MNLKMSLAAKFGTFRVNFYWQFNPFKGNEISHYYSFDQSISILRDVG